MTVGDHFYTTFTAERDNAFTNFGYVDEGRACFVFDSQAPGTTPLFRLLNSSNGDHFYTTSAGERDNAITTFGYTSEGTACFVFDSQASGTTPLFRLLKVADLRSAIRVHLKVLTLPNIALNTMVGEMRQVYTTAGVRVDIVPFGAYISEGTACFVFDSQAPGTTPLFRLLNSSNGDHFYTTSAGERDNAITTFGYTSEGIACFVFDSQAPGTTPLFRLLNSSNGDHFYTTSPGERDNASVLEERLNLPVLNDLDVGQCLLGQTTGEQNQLFANRNNVENNDIVIYFVRSTVPPFNGCAAHPAEQDGAVVAQGATRWTLAHEVGHVLGLNHVDDNNRLMTRNGTANITNPPPDLVDSEIQTMDASALTVNI